MNINKLQEAIAELRAEAADCLRLADDIEARIKRSSNGASSTEIGPHRPRLTLRRKGKKASYLSAAVDALRENKQPLHMNELVPKVAEKLRRTTTRASVESALVRGIKSGKWHIKRTGPGTFAVTQ